MCINTLKFKEIGILPKIIEVHCLWEEQEQAKLVQH